MNGVRSPRHLRLMNKPSTSMPGVNFRKSCVDSRYGFSIGNPARFGTGSYPDEHLYQAIEQLSWVHGTFLAKAGFEISQNTDATSRLRNETGTYHYSSIENFASDALAFAAFGLNGQLDPMDQHNCDQTGQVWRDSTGTLHGLGYLPCYSYYTQTMGPRNWWLSTSNWAGYLTSQWQPTKRLTLSLAARWERQQLPQALASLHNVELPLTQRLPDLGTNWSPRASIAWGSGESRWPVLRFGYGMYFGRTPNAIIQSALTQTGSLKGDLNFFIRPTDNLNAGGAPPFPYVLSGEPTSVVKPGAVEFDSHFRNGEIHQAEASIDESLPGHFHFEASAIVSLGRRLPITVDANVDPAINPKTITYAVVDGNRTGPIKTPLITVPYFAMWPSAASATGSAGRFNSNYQQIAELFSRANSTYEAAMFQLIRNGRGLTIHARYTYAHAMDWNPNESSQINGSSVLDPLDFRQEYGTSNLDVRHSVTSALIWQPKWRLGNLGGQLLNGWLLSGIGQFHSGLPYTMRTAGSLAREFDASGVPIVALGGGMNGYGGDNRIYGLGRNTYRYPSTARPRPRRPRCTSSTRTPCPADRPAARLSPHKEHACSRTSSPPTTPVVFRRPGRRIRVPDPVHRHERADHRVGRRRDVPGRGRGDLLGEPPLLHRQGPDGGHRGPRRRVRTALRRRRRARAETAVSAVGVR